MSRVRAVVGALLLGLAAFLAWSLLLGDDARQSAREAARPVARAPGRPASSREEAPPGPPGMPPMQVSPVSVELDGADAAPVAAPTPPSRPVAPSGPPPPKDATERAPPCDCRESRADFVDFSKPPDEIEGPDKVRLAIQPKPGPGGMVIEVTGTAYYPDDTVILVTLGHHKVYEPFARMKAVVRDRTFTVAFGPLTRFVPPARLTVAGWFHASSQTATVSAVLARDYLHSSPPCRHDRVNVTWSSFATGDPGDEARAEADEKRALGLVRLGIVDAGPDPATFEREAKKALDALAAFYGDRQFALFPRRRAQVIELAKAYREGRPERARELDRELLAFLAEADSLEQEAKREAEAALSDPPPATRGR